MPVGEVKMVATQIKVVMLNMEEKRSLSLSLFLFGDAERPQRGSTDFSY